jgi:hypothetical protein
MVRQVPVEAADAMGAMSTPKQIGKIIEDQIATAS